MNEIFENAVNSGNIAGAYVVSGTSDEQIRREAEEFLLHLFCAKGSACKACPGCKKVLGQTHADIYIVTPASKTIKIDDVRPLPAWVAQKPYEGGRKAVFIPSADTMTPQAQNALLKALEEPPAHTVFLLGAMNSRNLLPTIRSRCIILKTLPQASDAEKMLVEECSLTTLRARVLLGAAQGDYYLAKEYAEAGFFEVRNDMVAAIEKLLHARTMATSTIYSLLAPHEKQLGLAINSALLYMQDVLHYKHTGSSDVINEDQFHKIQEHARFSDRVLTCIMDKMYELYVKKEQCTGLNARLALDAALFSILEDII
ncbi:MAG: DNA polymerase III subunit delta' C-terminal domain-containing protein [Christensenellaceae bacterium]|jgi:DNA polymerase-3 subunit delta'